MPMINTDNARVLCAVIGSLNKEKREAVVKALKGTKKNPGPTAEKIQAAVEDLHQAAGLGAIDQLFE